MRRFLIFAVLALTGCGGTTHAPSSAPSVPSAPARGAVPRAATSTWPERWCEARVGMSRIALARLMGLPTIQDSRMIPYIPHVSASGVAPVRPPQPVGSDTWEAAGVRFNAFYGGHAGVLYVQQLDYNGSASLPCDGIRT